MSSNFDKLNPLQRRAVQLSAQGSSDTEVRDTLALSITTWETWRSDPIWNDALAELKTTDDDESDKRVDDALEELSR